MNRILSGLFVFLLCLNVGYVFAAMSEKDRSTSEPRSVTIAIFDFEGQGGLGVGRAVADMLITRLAPSPLFRVYERSRLDEVLEEKRRGQGEGDPKIRAARTLGVQFIILGKVTEFGVSENSVLIPGRGNVTKYKARTALDVRLVAVSDAQVLETWATIGAKSSFNLGVNIHGMPNFSFAGDEFEQSLLGQATRVAVDEMAGKIETAFRRKKLRSIVEELLIEGRVADVEGNKVIINIGESAGVKTGMAFDIFRLEKEVTDPETGELLMEKLDHIGELIVLEVEDNYSEASVLKLDNGEKIRVDDRVEEQESAKKKEQTDTKKGDSDNL